MRRKTSPQILSLRSNLSVRSKSTLTISSCSLKSTGPRTTRTRPSFPTSVPPLIRAWNSGARKTSSKALSRGSTFQVQLPRTGSAMSVRNERKTWRSSLKKNSSSLKQPGNSLKLLFVTGKCEPSVQVFSRFSLRPIPLRRVAIRRKKGLLTKLRHFLINILE